MTKAKISEYDAVAANNTDVNGVNIAENCPPSGMNNMGREIMAALKRFQVGSDGDGVTVGGNLVVSGTSTLSTTSISSADINAGTIDGTAIGGSTPAAVSATTLNTSGQVVFNDAGADVDFRVEGDTDANLLFVDASTDRVGIGTNPPSYKLDISTGGRAAGANYSTSGMSASSVVNIAAVENDLSKAATLTLTQFNSAGSISVGYASTFAGFMAFGTSNGAQQSPVERMRIDSSGILLVGTTNTDPTFNRVDGLNLRFDGRIYSRGGNWDLGLNTSSGTNISFYTDNGSARVTAGAITSNGATTAYGLGSDYRMKTNVEPMTGALAKVLELNPVTFIWKEEFAGTNPNGQGFIAHELQTICPDAVVGEKDATEMRQVLVSPAVPATYDDEGNELTPAVEAVYEGHEVPKYQSVDSSFLVATLTAAIQELSAKNDALEARIAALEA
jgi:hypothetical protein